MDQNTRPAGLIQRYREAMQTRRDARRRVITDAQRLRRFLRFHNRHHPQEMGNAELNALLTHLAARAA